ncbi:SAM-dependent methyltransferase [Streptomyces sp. NPDC093111]|uniref:SAM-dependent methyltransferase n=1 Tax=Streptomyces sp. NPDC093111 TaxID=3154978 RepID=UPI003436E2E4
MAVAAALLLADLRPPAVRRRPRHSRPATGAYGHLDRTEAFGVLAHGLLEWMDDATATTVMNTLRERFPACSALSLTHAATETAPEVMEQFASLYAETDILYRPRTLEQIVTLLCPWELLPPCIVTTAAGRRQDALPQALAAGRRRPRSMPPANHSHDYAAVITAPTSSAGPSANGAMQNGDDAPPAGRRVRRREPSSGRRASPGATPAHERARGGPSPGSRGPGR